MYILTAILSTDCYSNPKVWSHPMFIHWKAWCLNSIRTGLGSNWGNLQNVICEDSLLMRKKIGFQEPSSRMNGFQSEKALHPCHTLHILALPVKRVPTLEILTLAQKKIMMKCQCLQDYLGLQTKKKEKEKNTKKGNFSVDSLNSEGTLEERKLILYG